MTVLGWRLGAKARALLLERFPPVWPDVVADHVTLGSPNKEQMSAPDADYGTEVGHVSEGSGHEALVVNIDGTTVRPDGRTYHITWSIDRARGRKPKDSNNALARLDWNRLHDPILIRLIPAGWP